MKGFDNWRDLPDYIIGITHEIWEGRGLDTLHHYYAPDIPVRSPAGIVVGNKAVIAATMATIHEFPDRTLLADDVIWSGDEDTGFLSSHRLISTATHSADGQFGKATGKRLVFRIIADCAARNNTIDDEWLIRDQGAIVRQLGWDPKAWVQETVAREGGAANASRAFTPDQDIAGPYQQRGNDNEWGQRYADILARIMNADFATIERDYDRAVQLELPGGQRSYSHAGADAFWLGLRSAFPQAQFEVHHQIGREDPMMPPRAALRWSLTGTHDGWGSFGAPSGANVHVMGISHAEFGPYGLRREYVLFDETAIWKQIVMHIG